MAEGEAEQDLPVSLPSASRPTTVSVVDSTSTPAASSSADAQQPSLSRNSSQSSLSNTRTLYNIHKKTSVELRAAQSSSSSLQDPPKGSRDDGGRISYNVRPSSMIPSAHSASILPSSSFFNPRKPSPASPDPLRSPTGSGISSPRFSVLGSPDPQSERRGNGPIITRVTSEFASRGEEPTRRDSAELEEEEGLRRLSGLPPSREVLERVESRGGGGSRPSSPLGGYVAGGVAGGSEPKHQPSIDGLVRSASTSSRHQAGHQQQPTDSTASTSQLAHRPSTETSRTQSTHFLPHHTSREPLLDFNPSRTIRVDASSPARNSRRDSLTEDLRVTSPAVPRSPTNTTPRLGGPTGTASKPTPIPAPAALPPAQPIPYNPVLSASGQRIRNHKLHSGSNRFYLGGRILSSKDNPVPFIISLGLAVVLPVLFFAFSGPFLWDNLGGGGKASIFVFLYLWGIMITSMCKTAWRDPGIIPRKLDPLPQRKWVEDLYGEGEGGFRAEPRYMRLKEGVVASKWCETCATYRPPRTSHCRLCDNCVEHTDHHCTFLNNCIGRRNYTSFFAFLVSAIFCTIYAIAFSSWHISRRAARAAPGESWAGRWDVAGSFVVAVLSFALFCPIAGLFGYHVRLVWVNRTTIEMLRPKGDRSGAINPVDGKPMGNLYALQNPFANIVALLCRPMEVPSWIAPREWAKRDAREGGVEGGEREAKEEV
ncbi:hypothetical protein MNV49_002861 [Pseudohyphozyma bogoriensis]|nr:hypothetical protein MNV49_002861 [Pseudohyphozyma bogoriensis]